MVATGVDDVSSAIGADVLGDVGQLAEFIESRLIGATTGHTDDDADIALRAGHASSMLVGVVTGRRLIRVPLLGTADTEHLVALLAPAIHRILVPPADRPID